MCISNYKFCGCLSELPGREKNLVALILSICLVVTGGVSLVNGIKIKIDKTITYHNYYEFYNNAYPHEFDWEFEVYD